MPRPAAASRSSGRDPRGRARARDGGSPSRRRRQAPRGRGDVRPHRAALRPPEPHHLARSGPAVAAPHGRGAATGAGRDRARPRLRNGRPVRRRRGCRVLGNRRRLLRRHAGRRAHPGSPGPRRRAGAAGSRRVHRRRRQRVRAPQLRRSRRLLPGVRARAAARRACRHPRDRRAGQRRAPGRAPHVVPARRAVRRGDPVERRRGLPVPSPLDRLPAGTRRSARTGRGGRFRKRRSAHVHRGCGAAHHGNATMTVTSVAAGLVARTRAVDRPGDLLDSFSPDGFAWLSDGSGFVTSGVAARVRVCDVDRVLAGMEVDDPVARAGTGAIAVSALAFHDASAGELVIPASVVGVDADGSAWRTEIGSTSRFASNATPPPTRFSVEGRVSRAEWASQVHAILDALAAGDLAKAVLAREVVVHADAPFDARVVVDRLRSTQGGCVVFAAGGLVGATPELLVRRQGASVTSRPMAGTIPRGATDASDNAAEAALAASVKDGLEHRLVVDAVVDGLRAAGVDVTTVRGPEVARLATVSHLATTIAGTVEPRSARSALELALRLHPTPAVGGAPQELALAMLEDPGTFDRGRYAGPVGWVDAHGDGEWAVALRCAELEGSTARLVAGAGVVAGSDPDAEWAETQAKLEPMLRVLVQP